MTNKCPYVYLAGPKKNTICSRFIRSKNSNLCCQHKKKIEIIPPSPPPKEEEQIKRAEPITKLFKKRAVKLVNSEESESEEEPIRNKIPLNKSKEADESVSELQCSSSSDSSSFSISSDSSSSSFSVSDD